MALTLPQKRLEAEVLAVDFRLQPGYREEGSACYGWRPIIAMTLSCKLASAGTETSGP